MNTSQPNYELLKDAYAIIGGIPKEKIRLDTIITKRSGDLACGTVACAAGWLAMHPQFNALGLEVAAFNGIAYKGVENIYYDVMAQVFNISPSTAQSLFRARCGSEHHGTLSDLPDRELWLHRVRVYLKMKGQL